MKDKNALAYHEPEKFYRAELWKRREPTARLIIKGEERERWSGNRDGERERGRNDVCREYLLKWKDQYV